MVVVKGQDTSEPGGVPAHPAASASADAGDEAAEDDRRPSPDDLHELLAERGLAPDDVDQMVDVAAVGITARWWRNTKVEDWHAGSAIGALSDVDMYRINTHTTAKVRERLRRWRREQGLHTMVDVADADPAPLNRVFYNLYRWFTNPNRTLIIGTTLRDVVAQTLSNARTHPDCDVPDNVTTETELEDYDNQVAGAAGYLLESMDEYDPRSVLYSPALFATVWARRWWGLPDYPSHVDRVFAVLADPGHRTWQNRPIPPPPDGVNLVDVRKKMLTKPWELPDSVCQWLINDAAEHYIFD
ncbi:hypothetical protein FraEuI1c_0894 [Pseudofrankia inefficax]|uniref:Uncharacterized protein n=2 Tax=Pseudofrankia inefficax (strain DSM 45817 / CECT 9037 / DDB 130130 / EuI1c) TaxID=298654 RepID=E3IXF3_PSEI1|nr:hypothetical protein FraEuI1c_0894 [Pseudofrankia inefficax]